MTRRFKVVIETESEGGYSIHVPALSGCASQGETKEEALANIKEAIELYLASMKEDNLPFPSADVDLLIKDIAVVV